MARNTFLGDDGKAVWKMLENITCKGYDSAKVFNDWISLSLNALLSMTDNFAKENFIQKLRTNKLDGKFEDRYIEIVKKYRENQTDPKGKRPIDYFVTAWDLLTQETRQKQKDILGEVYQQKISHGENQQYFTPGNVTDMMAKMIGKSSDGETVCDPCCGSGRMMISSYKVNPYVLCYGKDIDLRCVKMCTLNAWMFDMNAVIQWGNGLDNKSMKEYIVRKGGLVYEVDIKKG